MADVVAEALDFIREHEPPEGYFVGFSGGKDSIVTLALVREAGVKHKSFYSATGIDPPEIVRFIRREYPEVVFLRPKMTFWDGIRRKSPPPQDGAVVLRYSEKTPRNARQAPGLVRR